MKKVMFILTTCLISFQAYSQTKKEKITELLELTQSEKMINESMDNMLQVMKNQTNAEFGQEQGQAMMAFAMGEMKIIMKKIMSEDFPAIYEKYLDETDIDAIIVFYKSPAGQKFIDVQPKIQKEFMLLLFQKYMPEFQSKLEQKKKELKSK